MSTNYPEINTPMERLADQRVLWALLVLTWTAFVMAVVKSLRLLVLMAMEWAESLWFTQNMCQWRHVINQSLRQKDSAWNMTYKWFTCISDIKIAMTAAWNSWSRSAWFRFPLNDWLSTKGLLCQNCSWKGHQWHRWPGRPDVTHPYCPRACFSSL